MAGVTRQAISAVESGLSDPSLRLAIALSRALGLTVEGLGLRPDLADGISGVTGLADAGVASEPAASAYDLAFIPLAASSRTCPDMIRPDAENASQRCRDGASQ